MKHTGTLTFKHYKGQMGEYFGRWFDRFYRMECVGEGAVAETVANDRSNFQENSVDVHIMHVANTPPTPASNILWQRAVNSMIARLVAQGGASSAVISTSPLTSLLEPVYDEQGNTNSNAPRVPKKQKECPICRMPVDEPIQCFAIPENVTTTTTCCVCGEEKNMRLDRTTLSCMHPLCIECFTSMPAN